VKAGWEGDGLRSVTTWTQGQNTEPLTPGHKEGGLNQRVKLQIMQFVDSTRTKGGVKRGPAPYLTPETWAVIRVTWAKNETGEGFISDTVDTIVPTGSEEGEHPAWGSWRVGVTRIPGAELRDGVDRNLRRSFIRSSRSAVMLVAKCCISTELRGTWSRGLRITGQSDCQRLQEWNPVASDLSRSAIKQTYHRTRKWWGAEMGRPGWGVNDSYRSSSGTDSKRKRTKRGAQATGKAWGLYDWDALYKDAGKDTLHRRSYRAFLEARLEPVMLRSLCPD